jgi:hypothetical protein
MSVSNAVVRVFLFARALRVPTGGPLGGCRALRAGEVDALLFALRRRAVPPLDIVLLGDWFEGGAVAYVPLFARSDLWAFGSCYNSRTLLRSFWRAVLEMLFDAGFAADDAAAGVPHQLVFFSQDRRYQVEITDEWGDGWYLILQLADAADPMLARRSRAGTPEVLRVEDDA